MADTALPRAAAIASGALPAYRLLAIQVALIAALVVSRGFHYNGRDINLIAGMLGALIVVAILVRRRGGARVATAIEAGALLLASSVIVACLSVLVATLSPPYQDAALARADGWLFPFLSWPAMVAALAPHDRLVAAMAWIYGSLLWQPFVLIALLAATGRERVVWRFLHAWLLALIVCVAIFALMPATTAAVHYAALTTPASGFSVTTGWRPAAILAAIRSGAVTEIGGASMAGLITFPSFHAAGATLLAWGFRRLGVLGWGFVALDAGVILCTPMIGSHYFVDVAGGVAVAALALAGTRQSAAREPGLSPSPGVRLSKLAG